MHTSKSANLILKNSLDCRSWILAARPKTLVAAVAPIACTAALAKLDSAAANMFVLSLCLICALLLQIATNFINDAADFESGADTGERLGPKRAAQSGLLAPQQLYRGAYVCLLLTFVLGLYLSYIGGWPIFTAGIFSILFAYLYTKGPYPLAYYGLGDLFVFIFFGPVAVNGVYFLLTNAVSDSSIALGLIMGLLALPIMISNNIRDIPTDIKANKWTIATRIGEQNSKFYYSVVLLFIYIAAFHLLKSYGSLWTFTNIAFLIPLTLASVLVLKMWRAKEGSAYNQLLELSAIHLVLFSSSLFLAIIAKVAVYG